MIYVDKSLSVRIANNWCLEKNTTKISEEAQYLIRKFILHTFYRALVLQIISVPEYS